MKTSYKILTIVLVLLGCTACKKDPELQEHKYHELIEGRIVYFYFYHNAGFQYHWDTDAKGIKNFIKKEKNIYSLVDSFNRILKIDSIILNTNNDQVTISMLTDIYAFKDPHYEIYFKNARTISEDSLIGEFYDAYFYIASTRQWIPTQGTFAMKINK
jgi:hypothetical protein